MLKLQELKIKRGHKTVIDHIHAHFTPGQFIALLGENGAGKSTLLHALCLDIPFQGHISLFAQPLGSWSAERLAMQRAVLPQQPISPAGLTVEELVCLSRFGYREGLDTSAKIADKWLAALKLLELKGRDLSHLSGGQLQRCHIARCLAQLDNQLTTPKLLLLDEPTAALDVHQQHRCLQQIKTFATAGNLVIAVLHDLNLAALYADQVLLLDQGQISALGTPEHVLAEQPLSKLYQTKMHVCQHPRLACPMIFSEPHTEL
ncbi:hemin import ATP-binding protein HmuV [Alishewanella longhuensis]|uniref:Hemin import ATP-binding protein HmuV n=1 Tax=Alishewanella longhuensis TaxID=1091037 RepID=A0ABQ3L095_9ALTE|nr:heme ABC transporter ATP-binding protein [Alishewanella longhuensis]GHG71459.1 hemin import ATP-binding protein HmuV [Alishewanella longhuensis]